MPPQALRRQQFARTAVSKQKMSLRFSAIFLSLALLLGACSGQEDKAVSPEIPGTQTTEATSPEIPDTQTTSAVSPETPGTQTAVENTLNVPSDMFSGEIILSSDGVPIGVELDRIYSRIRPASIVESRKSILEWQEPSTFGYILELRSASGEILRSIPFEVDVAVADIEPGNWGFGTSTGLMGISFYFFIFDPPEYTNFSITWRGTQIAGYTKSENSPSVILTGPSDGQVFTSGDTIDISWVGSDSDGDDLTYRVYYSTDGGETYGFLSFGTTDTTLSISANELEGSPMARIGVSVSDGLSSSFWETHVFSLPNDAPSVRLETPSSRFVFDDKAEKQGFIFDAVGRDKEDGNLASEAFSWSSSIDGSLGTGQHLVLVASDLSPGIHIITVTAVDRYGVSATDQTTLIINPINTPPEANDDNISVALNEKVLIDVLDNDIDIERYRLE